MAKSPSLTEGAARMTKVVREARRLPRELGNTPTLEGPAQNPKDAWARRYMSEGFSPDAPSSTAYIPGTGEKPSAHNQAQFMKELKAKVGEGHGKRAQPYGKMAMQRPFAPGKRSEPKRSIWSRMTRGS